MAIGSLCRIKKVIGTSLVILLRRKEAVAPL
jgi:hypothetical protein